MNEAAMRLVLCPIPLTLALLINAQSLDFSQDRAMVHVRTLAGLDDRTAGSPRESEAARYLCRELRAQGYHVRVEPFQFRRFHLDTTVLTAGSVTYRPLRIIVDPYSRHRKLIAPPVLLSAAVVNGDRGIVKLDLAGKLVISTRSAYIHRIAARRPLAIVLLDDEAFTRLESAPAAPTAALEFAGRVETVTSANVVATRSGTRHSREVLLTAHYDSFRSPGAQDNASGVAALLELARTLQLPDSAGTGVRIVFFGAEEEGLLGSQAYVRRHWNDRAQYILHFNLDSVGGRDIWIDMRGGVRDVPDPVALARPPRTTVQALTGFDGRWLLLGAHLADPDASTVPPWLQSAIIETARELGYPIHQGQGAGSDHRTFSQAGVAATNIAIGGISAAHTPLDLPDVIVPASLEKAARLVAGVVLRAAARSGE